MSIESQATVDEILKEHRGGKRDALIPILQKVQEVEGYLSKNSIARIGSELGLPASKIYGVATFYNQFRFQPQGRHHLTICRGTACHVKGSKKLLEDVTSRLGIDPGETSADRLFSLEVVACMGACGLAPVVSVNGEFHAKVTPKRLDSIIAACRATEVENVEA